VAAARTGAGGLAAVFVISFPAGVPNDWAARRITMNRCEAEKIAPPSRAVHCFFESEGIPFGGGL